MGFYSFIKWVRSFSKRHYDNMIRWYNESLLTDEKKEKRKYEYRTMLAKLVAINTVLSDHI